MSGRGHQRTPSEGLNVGEGFPTTYSSFATDSGRSTGRVGHATSKSLSARKRPGVGSELSPPLVPLDVNSLDKSSSSSSNAATAPSTPFLGFDTSSPGERISTQKSWQTLINEFKKRWAFVVFFTAFCLLLTFGILLPSSTRRTSSQLVPPGSSARSTTVRRTGVAKREGIYKGSHRTSRQDVEPTPVVQRNENTVPVVDSANTNRFARWAATVFQGAGSGNAGRVGGVRPIAAGLGDLEMPDSYQIKKDATEQARSHRARDEDYEKAISSRSRSASSEEIDMTPPSRRSKKRTADDEDRDAHEHPSRVARRKKLQERKDYATLEQEENARRQNYKKNVMARVARALKDVAASPLAAVGGDNDAGPANPPGHKSEDGYEHVLSRFKAAHPELVDEDGAFAGMPGDLDYEEED